MKRTLLVSLSIVFLLWPSAVIAQDGVYVPGSDAPDGEELVLIYIGAYNCGPCHSPELKAVIPKLKLLFYERAKASGKDFATMGIALDWEVEVGYDYLKEIGPWDEVIVGKNWTNLGASVFIWREPETQAAMPQILLARRDVDISNHGSWIEDYEVIASHMNIVEWYEQGALWTNE